MRIPLQVQSLTISPHLQELQHTAENRVKLITPPPEQLSPPGSSTQAWPLSTEAGRYAH